MSESLAESTARYKLAKAVSDKYPKLAKRVVLTAEDGTLKACLTVNNRLVSSTLSLEHGDDLAFRIGSFVAEFLFQIRQTRSDVGSHRSEI